MDGPVQAPLSLRLYVSGTSAGSGAVEANLRQLFDEVGLVFDVEVLDVDEHPDAAEEDRIVLTPTIIRLTPPRLRVAGDLSNIEAAMDGLGLRLWGRRARVSQDGHGPSTDGVGPTV
jgi:circadian clock protein KaiB